MGDFFKPWRRKFGVLTLLMALVVMVGWVRSFFYAEGFSIPSRTKTAVHSFQSNQDGLSWAKESCLENPDHWKDNQYVQIGSARHSGQSVLNSLGAIRHNWLGFEVVDITYRHSNLRSGPNGDQVQMNVRIIPYWSITIPLTLISAVLLLSKPLKSTQKKTGEPVPKSWRKAQ